MSLLPKMYRHLAWADQRTLRSLSEMSDPPQQAIDLFAHVVGAEREWICRILGEKSDIAIWPTLELEQCETIAQENHAALAQLAEQASTVDGQRMITYRNSSGAEWTTSLEDILLHVANHGVYHRGQIALLVRGAGGKAIGTDYVLFARE